MPTDTFAPPHHSDFEYVDSSGDVHEYRLRSNGLQTLIMREASAPVVTFMVTYRVGSRNEVPGLTGATHFLEHLMFKGSTNYNRENGKTVFNVLQTLGAQVNATTWFDRTNYYEQLPREHLSVAVEIEADRMRGALLRDEDVESERTVILNELDRGENEPLRRLYHAVWSTAFVAHPYHHPTIGWRSDVETTTREGLRRFYDQFYWPNNATVSVIGDVEGAEVLSLISERFGTIAASPHEIIDVVTEEPDQDGERRVVVRRVGQLGSLMVAFKQPAAQSPDTDALEVLSVLLTAGKSSRLFRRLTDAGLTTNVGASASALRDPGLFYVFGMLAPGVSHDKVENEIREELRAIQEGGVTDHEITRARNQLRAQEAFGRDGSFSIASQLNEAIAAGDWKLYTTAIDRIESVSTDDVVRVASTYCVDDRMTVGYYVPRTNGSLDSNGREAAG